MLKKASDKAPQKLRGKDVLGADWIKLPTSIFDGPKLSKIRRGGTKAAERDALALLVYVAAFGRIADSALLVEGETRTDVDSLAEKFLESSDEMRRRLDLFSSVGWIDATSWSRGVVAIPWARDLLRGMLVERTRGRNRRAKSKFNPPTTIEDDSNPEGGASADAPRTVRRRSAARGEGGSEAKERDDGVETSQDGDGWPPPTSSSPSGGSLSAARACETDHDALSQAKPTTPRGLVVIWNHVMEQEERDDLRCSRVLSPRETDRVKQTLRRHREWIRDELVQAVEEDGFVPPASWEEQWWRDTIRKAARHDFLAGRDPKAREKLLNFGWITRGDNAWRVHRDDFGGREMTDEEREQLERRQMQLERERETERELLRDRIRRGEAA